MRTPVQKIQDAARRIVRLGKYADDLGGMPQVIHEGNGVLRLHYGAGVFGIMCVPKEGRVWIRLPGQRLDGSACDESDLNLDSAGQWLAKFESEIREKAKKKAREEVISELAEKRLHRVVRSKNRAFKADQRKGKKRDVA